MKEIKTLNAVNVKPEARAIEVSWTVKVQRDDDTVVASEQFNRAYSRYERAKFLEDLAGEPTAVAYADLAGLETLADL